MSQPNAQTTKKALIQAGFEIFRTRPDEIVLSERVRENLIMDSGVRLRLAPTYEVRIIFRVQLNDFPSEDEPTLFARARELAGEAIQFGFTEIQSQVSPVSDPADPERTLDTFYEVVFGRTEPSFEAAIEGLRFALKLEKTASRKGSD